MYAVMVVELSVSDIVVLAHEQEHTHTQTGGRGGAQLTALA